MIIVSTHTVEVLFNDPNAPADYLAGVPRGHMAPDQVVRMLQDVAAACNIVGLAITEYMPWEAITTRKLLHKLPMGEWKRAPACDSPGKYDIIATCEYTTTRLK